MNVLTSHTFFVVVDRRRPPSYRVKVSCSDCLTTAGWTTKAAANRFLANHQCRAADVNERRAG